MPIEFANLIINKNPKISKSTTIYIMSTILIKSNKENNKILASLAKKLGGNVINVNDSQFEDLMLGKFMDSVKTGETVSKNIIMNKLKVK